MTALLPSQTGCRVRVGIGFVGCTCERDEGLHQLRSQLPRHLVDDGCDRGATPLGDAVHQGRPPPGQPQVVRRALVVGAALTTGFVLVFGALGAAVTVLSFGLGPWLSVLTIATGTLLLAVGLVLLAGRDVSVRMPRARLPVGSSTGGMVAYGVVYATVSLSCTLPVFVVAVVSAFTVRDATPLTGVLAVLAYACGMGVVVTTLAVVVGFLGREGLGRARASSRHVGRVSGLIVTLAAVYVLGYGWVELQTYDGRPSAFGPITWVAHASARVSQTITDAGALPLVILCGAVVAVVVTVDRIRARRRRMAHH